MKVWSGRTGRWDASARWTAPLAAGVGVAVLALLTACDAFLEGAGRPEQSAWEGTLVPVEEEGPSPAGELWDAGDDGDDEESGGEGVTGTVAAVDHGGQTDLQLNISTAPPLTEFGWLFRFGTCDGSGDPVGPPMQVLETTEDGSYSSTLTARMSLDPSEEYALEVMDDGGNGRVLSCADMERVG